MNPDPFPPVFNPGDMVEVIGIAWPPESKRIKSWLGLFEDVGYPVPLDNIPEEEHGRLLNEHLVGHVMNGTRCIVVAVRFSKPDSRWYYLLRAPEFEKCFGWTRSITRLKLVIV